MLSLALVLRWILLAAQGILTGVSLYQSAITLAGRLRTSRRSAPKVLADAPTPRFGLVVCARNEESVVGDIVRDLLDQSYPAGYFEVLVVAHNCSDATAEVAEAAGARVLRLQTPEAGKAFAVQAGMECFAGNCDFIGVFDADTRVSPGLLNSVAVHSQGETCLQAEAVPAAADDWLAEGYGFGRLSRNMLWWRPRAALGLGTTIVGTGFFVRPSVLGQHFRGLRTLTEDLELTARLAGAGYRVAYVPDTRVQIDEPHRLGLSVHQRLRWVRGHFGVIRYEWPALATRAARGDRRALDLAIYLLVPTRVITRTGVTAAAALALAGGPAAMPMPLLVLALAGEWALPVWAGLRDGLLPTNAHGARLAVRHGLLSLLWFPIGLWGLVTANARVWSATPRARKEDRDAVASHR